MNDRCRVCARTLPESPLLTLEGMPLRAQQLPDESALAADRGADLRVLECGECGLVQLAGSPVPYYRDVIRAAGLSAEMRSFRQAQFAEFVRRFDLRGRKVIEVGCGRGEYLALMREAGADALGLEHSAAAVAACAAAGLPAARGFVAGRATRVPQAPFDAFFTLNYLEHLPRPAAFLAGVRANLRARAPGLIEVPNFDMIVRVGLFAEFIPDHLLYFTARSLRTLLEGHGFEVLEMGETWHDYVLSVVVRASSGVDAAVFHVARERLTRELAAFVGRHPPGRVAVWGAGHQALAVLALSGISGKLRYVVDSAPFKQGRFTPATHLPIVAPERLETDPVDAVVVMAAAYSDEVASGLLARFGGRIEVAVVRGGGVEPVRG